jgi:GTP-binding protein HflX
LLNTLTNSQILAEQRMFATLDPTSRRLRLPREQEVVINDTVGFIRDLPPDLLSAFRATLEEVSDSNLLIHLVDAASPRRSQQIEAVERILAQLGLAQTPCIVALNKADLVNPEEIETIRRQVALNNNREVVVTSALQANSLEPLLDKAGSMLARDLLAPFSESEPGAKGVSRIA